MYAPYLMSSRKSNNSKPENSSIYVGLKTPSFLTVTNSPITSSGTFEIEYNNTPLPIYAGGTGLTAPGSTGQVLSVISMEPEQLGWIDGEGTGTVTSVSLTVPDFLTVSPSVITSSGTFDISLSSEPIPISSGGTGLVSLGSPKQFLSVNASGTALEYTTPSVGVTSITLGTSTPFLSVSQDPVTSSGPLTIDCSTIPVSYGGTGLTEVGSPGQVLAVSLDSTLEYTDLSRVVSVSLTTNTPFLTTTPAPVTSIGTLTVDCSTIPISHGGTGLTTLGDPKQILAVNSLGSAFEFVAVPESVTSVGVSTTTPFLSVSNTPVTSSGTLTIDCSTIPVSHGGTGLTTLGLPNQILASDGTYLHWTDPPLLDQYLTFINTVSPLSYSEGVLAITSFTGSGKVVYDNSPILNTPILGDATCTSISMNGAQSGAVRLSSKSGSYNFILPESIGQPNEILTSQGPFVPTIWSSTTGAGPLLRAPVPTISGQILSVGSDLSELVWVNGEGTGTVTSVSLSSSTPFLTVSETPITSAGPLTINCSTIPTSHGGTGLTSLGEPTQILTVNSSGTALEYVTPFNGVTAVTLSTATPFLSVSENPVTSSGTLTIDCSTIPISHGGTGLTSIGEPAQILTVNSLGTALEFSAPLQAVTSVSLSSSTPFLIVSETPITSTGYITVDCSTIPTSHGGTGLTVLGEPTQILAVNSSGTALEFSSLPQSVTSVSLSTTTPFMSVSNESITSYGTLSVDCATIPVSHGGTGLTTPGLQNQILVSNGSALEWVDPPVLDNFLTNIETTFPLSYSNNTLAISSSTGSGSVVCDIQPVLNTPTLVDPTTNCITIGTVTLKSSLGNYDFILPSSSGESSQVLTSQGMFNPLKWTSTSGSGNIVCSQSPILTGQTIFTNGTVVCKSTMVQSKGIVEVTQDTTLTVEQFNSLLIINSENSVVLTAPSVQQFHDFIGDMTIGNRISTLIYNKCPSLTIVAASGITVIDGRYLSNIPVQECTYIMTNAEEGLLLIK